MSGKTWNDLFAAAGRELSSAFEQRQLFTHCTGMSPSDLLLRGGEPAEAAADEALLALCRRRQQGEPLQYLIGEWEFYSLPFFVGEGVLIPRADTETLVDAALEVLRDQREPKVLDLCSGSGCIAIALQHQRPDAVVTAVEYSPEALAYLERNKARNRSEIQIVAADVRQYHHPEPLDLIVSNPPYIPRLEIAGLQREVQQEPRLALDGGQDGLDFYRSIARRYREQLRPGGALCFEVGAGQAPEVSAILQSHHYRDIQVRNDLTGIQRVVLAIR